ncbi:unnamed protein product [Adineta ricciae]|uniref:G-protein coupled receptors family 1 profile domain-containing protein n=1 Tax=Adineta ricciae TaxID=249248 RepID=A0A815EL39_ADIRI|nr:unnamed protein product [Adineta ricciae]
MNAFISVSSKISTINITDHLTGRYDSLNIYIFLTGEVVPKLILACFILGLFGFLVNMFTFLQPDLRSNACCIYTLSSSVIDIVHLSVNIFPNYLGFQYNIPNPWIQSFTLCKLHYFLYNFFPQLATNLLLLSIIDRYACSCGLTSWITRLNQYKMIPRLMTMMVIISGIFSIYAPIFGTDIPQICGFHEKEVYGILTILISGVLQPIVMLLFVLLTYQNIRQRRQRVVSKLQSISVIIPTQRSFSVLGCGNKDWCPAVSTSVCNNDNHSSFGYSFLFPTMDDCTDLHSVPQCEFNGIRR